MLVLLVVACLTGPVQALTDPVTTINGYLMLVLMVVALFFVIKYRDRVLFLITGDNQVHVDFNSSLWIVFCTCCRQCTGEWTKCVSYVLCFPCKSLRGRNLKRMLGQLLGVVPIPVQISNIVVGDLPMYTTQDIFLSVEVGTTPAQITSTCEDARPKVAQFPDTMLVRVRRSIAEGHVRFCVKAVHAFGCTELCECYINPMILVQWSNMQRGPKRFRMDPIDRQRSDALFPPWLLMELNPMQEWGGTPLTDFSVRLTNTQTGEVEAPASNPGDFKSRYRLLNTYGIAAEEPDENIYGKLDKMRQRRGACLTQSCGILWLVILIFGFLRIYNFACYREYQIIHILDNYQLDFPVSEDERDHYTRRCGLGNSIILDLLSGVTQRTAQVAMETSDEIVTDVYNNMTGANGSSLLNQLHERVRSRVTDAATKAAAAGYLKERMNTSIAQELCSVNATEVDETCEELPFGCATPSLNLDLLGQISVSLPCSKDACSTTDFMRRLDLPVIVFCTLLFLASLVVGAIFDQIIGRMEDRLRHGGHDPDELAATGS